MKPIADPHPPEKAGLHATSVALPTFPSQPQIATLASIGSGRTLLRMSQVIVRTGLSRSTIYAYMKSDKFQFPKPYLIGGRAVRFLESEIDACISRQIGK